MKYELSEQVVNNIIVFLDRCTFSSLKEHGAITDILNALSNPIQENKEQQQINQKQEEELK